VKTFLFCKPKKKNLQKKRKTLGKWGDDKGKENSEESKK
jgi:hypothetical protein